VTTLGVDEHIWRPSRIGVDRAVTIIVDLSRDQSGCLHARLLDAVVGRSGRRGHKHDPLYKIRGLLRPGVEHLTEKQQAKISHCLNAGDPQDEVNIAWQCYQQLRSIYHAVPAKGRQIAQKVLDSFHTCPIPEVARLGRTLRAWKAQILAYFDTSGVSNGGTEAINLIIERSAG
jgi:transposase